MYIASPPKFSRIEIHNDKYQGKERSASIYTRYYAVPLRCPDLFYLESNVHKIAKSRLAILISYPRTDLKNNNETIPQ